MDIDVVFEDAQPINVTLGESTNIYNGGGAVDSVNGQTGTVVLNADDISDASTTNKFVTSADKTKLNNLSGTNTGDQTAATTSFDDSHLQYYGISGGDVQEITDNLADSFANTINGITENVNEKADKTTTVNGHALSSNVTVSKSDVGLGNVTNDVQVKASDVDTTTTLGTSDVKVPSQKAVKTYVDTKAGSIPTTSMGLLADRPITGTNAGQVYYATDSSIPVSVWDGSVWTDIDTSTSNLLTSLKVSATPATFDLPANTSVYPAFLQTEDIVHPAGLVEVTCYNFQSLGSSFDTSGTSNDGVQLVVSTDGGTTWTGISPFGQAYQKTIYFQFVSNLMGIDDKAAGTTVRYGIKLLSAGGKTGVQLVPGIWLVARRM